MRYGVGEMRTNPVAFLRGRLSNRLSHAIDWRVRREFDSEREVFEGLRTSNENLAIAVAQQIKALSDAVDRLERRITEIENR
jgi:hypothetical protein